MSRFVRIEHKGSEERYLNVDTISLIWKSETVYSEFDRRENPDLPKEFDHFVYTPGHPDRYITERDYQEIMRVILGE